jgi:hypothetical protein
MSLEAAQPLPNPTSPSYLTKIAFLLGIHPEDEAHFIY